MTSNCGISCRRRNRTWAVVFALLVMTGVLCCAQDTSGQYGGSDQNATYGGSDQNATYNDQNSAPPELSASRIITILQENPDVANNLRSMAAQNGVVMSDQQVLQRIQTDENFRIQLTQYFIDQGIVDRNDPELQANAQNRANQNDQGGQSPAGGLQSQQQNNPGNQTSQGQGTVLYQSNQGRGTGPIQRSPISQSTGSVQQPNENGNNRPIIINPQRSTPQEQTNVSSDAIPTWQQKIPKAYRDIPAVRDLYAQVRDFNANLQRFGVEALQMHGPAADAPDVSAGPDYILGPGDSLSLTLWGGISREMRLIVDREGRISLPEVGTVMLEGKSLSEARDLVQKALSTQYHDIHSDLSLNRVRNVRVYVVGDVIHPGAYDISALSTVLNAVSVAGGPTTRGSLRRIKHLRGDKLMAEVDLYDLLLNGIRGKIAGLAPGDTILVPPVGPQVTVTGMVRRPAIYELKNEGDLAQVLDLAGGVLPTASYRQVRIERVQAHEQKMMLSLNLPNPRDPASVKTALAGFKPQDGDRIVIGSIAPYSNQSVYLDGHVIRPGKYSFHQGMDVSELLHSYQDLLPEPSDHAEIIRLAPPDMHPEVISFNLREVLDKTDPITLQPFDTVRIFGRYDIDSPVVAIYGEVNRPGEYPMSDGMTAVDLVRMAGGLKRSAYTETADLASYTVSNNKSVEVDSRTVEIGKALKGVEDTDVRLKPRDVLTIRQLAGWNTVGTVVKVTGEVNYPGTYGIVEGEKLSSVLKRAGAFRDDAYPRGAVLNRQEVREINDKARQTLVSRMQTMIPDVRVDPSEAPGLIAAAQAQQQQMIKRLLATPASGRQLIRITSDISKWENTPADIELRPGDEIIVPKYPTFVTVQGQVNSPSAITFTPGKKATWYFKRAGGHTPAASMKDAFVIRADGTVVGRGSESGFWSGGVMSTQMYPGDTLVIPEKIITGNTTWRALLQTAQVMSSVAITAGVLSNF